MNETWTIGELAQRAAEALRAHAQPVNGRVREVPGERLIRWYTTIGLLDPPLARRGRVAQYGRRHLLQLVAVKRLQAAGHSIADVQAALTGATDAMLEDAAHLPPARTGIATPSTAPSTAPSTVPSAPGEAPRERFWAERPGERAAHRAGALTVRHEDVPLAQAGQQNASQTGPLTGGTDGRPHREPRALVDRAPEAGGGGAGAIWGVRLGDGVRIVVDGAGRSPSDDDVQAVLAAAAPLVAVLVERKLV
ncbi:MerR family transcriptional regulator [Nonomuraea sp. NPDC005983]|uniref:MerR family transcriptional regulator n=1 Tax=Nonomuraea sp. NPDC005983 TaxID=3155595 RepID=UPI0033AB482D